MWNSKLLYALRDKYYSLSKRERGALIAVCLAVLVFLLAQFLLFPMNDRLDRLRASIKIKEGDLSSLKAIVSQYRRFDAIRVDKGTADEEETFNLFSVLEQIATRSGLMDKIDYMKPGSLQLDNIRQEKWVEVKLSQITLKEFTSYLHNLSISGKGIYIKRLSARKDGNYLNLTLQPAVMKTG